jgi:hypothetical protein
MSEPRLPDDDPAAVTVPALSKLSDEDRREITAAILRAKDERDLPKFQEAVARLGLDPNSAQYEKLMQLWEDFARASRHP